MTIPNAAAFHTISAHQPPAPADAARLAKRRGRGWCALALATSACWGCSEPARAAPGEPAGNGFSIVSPRVADAVQERSYVAELVAKQRVEIRSRIKGFIESVAIDEGERVEAGQLLFRVNVNELQQQDAIARAAIARAEADLQAASLERDNTRLLHEGNVVSDAELALANSKLLAAKAALGEARATRAAINLEYSRVLAPFPGVVNRIPLRAGSPVDDSAALTTLTDTSEVFAYFRVSEAEYLQYTSSGQSFPKRVWLRLADGNVFPSAGVVDAVESEFDPGTGSLALRARFPNEDGRLKHGGTGAVIVKTQLEAALMVPQKSTFEAQEQVYVYVVDPSNIVHTRRITPMFRMGDSFVVASGLDENDRFVLEGVQRLEDGMRVEALQASATSGS
jgi:membrane fusion protein (multidrug efflux system)